MSLPGDDLVTRGLADLAAGDLSVEALLIAIGAPRLRGLGVLIPEALPTAPEHRLYAQLASERAGGAHSRYNALIRRLVSYERALASRRRREVEK